MIPGFIDLQVNGYKGISFSTKELTHEDCIKIFREYLIESSCCMFLPTVITCSNDTYEHVLPIISDIMNKEEFQKSVPGIHLEGPFISFESRGAHDEKYIKKINMDFFMNLCRLSKNKIKIVTIAADCDGIEEFIKFCNKKNIIVSLGHQNANTKQIINAQKYGASSLTHLGNGMPTCVDRHHNPFMGGLANDSLVAMIITDGFHLPNFIIKIILKVKGVNNTIIVSDISPIGGLPPGDYSGHGMGDNMRIEENGKLHIPSRNCLAGSSMNMKQCVDYLKSLNLLSEKEIEKVAYYNPYNLLFNIDQNTFTSSYCNL